MCLLIVFVIPTLRFFLGCYKLILINCMLHIVLLMGTMQSLLEVVYIVSKR